VSWVSRFVSFVSRFGVLASSQADHTLSRTSQDAGMDLSALADILETPSRCRTALAAIPMIPTQLRCDIEAIRRRRRLTSPAHGMSACGRCGGDGHERQAGRRWWAAYTDWRIEHEAIGLTRTAIPQTAGAEAAREARLQVLLLSTPESILS